MKGHKLLSLSRWMDNNIWDRCPRKVVHEEEFDLEVSHEICMEYCEAIWFSPFYIWCPGFPKDAAC